jgi:threonine dehydrogenase-like Zn-dependent dehydrogenase
MSGKCVYCNEGEVIESQEKNHKVKVLGQEVVLPVAIVGRCNKCGQVNYALRDNSVFLDSAEDK